MARVDDLIEELGNVSTPFAEMQQLKSVLMKTLLYLKEQEDAP